MYFLNFKNFVFTHVFEVSHCLVLSLGKEPLFKFGLGKGKGKIDSKKGEAWISRQSPGCILFHQKTNYFAALQEGCFCYVRCKIDLILIDSSYVNRKSTIFALAGRSRRWPVHSGGRNASSFPSLEAFVCVLVSSLPVHSSTKSLPAHLSSLSVSLLTI